jgi:hypothetical protein
LPWPDLSELTFGFSFLREFEQSFAPGGTFPKAPDFISQYDEATLGYDVNAWLDNSTPVFFQFKRSFVVRSSLAKEITAGDFAGPILYRMHLRRKNDYAQHRALQDLETAGNAVFYITSQIESSADLTAAYTSGTVLDQAAAWFSPVEIALPNLTEDHWLTFRASDTTFRLYSEQGFAHERKYRNWSDSIGPSLVARRRSTDQNLATLTQVVSRLAARDQEATRLARRFEHPAIQASILAFLTLDAQLTFFKAKSDD